MSRSPLRSVIVTHLRLLCSSLTDHVSFTWSAGDASPPSRRPQGPRTSRVVAVALVVVDVCTDPVLPRWLTKAHQLWRGLARRWGKVSRRAVARTVSATLFGRNEPPSPARARPSLPPRDGR